MRYAQIRNMDISNGIGIGIALYTSGCPFHCKNCFNKELWDFNSGKEYTSKEKDYIVSIIRPKHIKRFSILGGEPLIDRNIEDLITLIKEIKKVKPEIKIWLYTGNIFENVINKYNDLIKLIDIIVDGPFIDEEKDITLQFRGSRNQRIIDVQKSLCKGEVIEYGNN